ncbi:MAG: hypothetical protein ACE10B_09240, partial [Phycisphaerales bacterium]
VAASMLAVEGSVIVKCTYGGITTAYQSTAAQAGQLGRLPKHPGDRHAITLAHHRYGSVLV